LRETGPLQEFQVTADFEPAWLKGEKGSVRPDKIAVQQQPPSSEDLRAPRVDALDTGRGAQVSEIWLQRTDRERLETPLPERRR